MRVNQRLCIVCNQYKDKSELNRYIHHEGKIINDNDYAIQARSSYVCREGECRGKVNEKYLRKRLKIK